MNPCSHWLFNYRPEDHIFIRHYTGQQKPSFSYDNGAIKKRLSHIITVVQLLSCVQLFATLWTAAHQASLPFTISGSLLKLMSIESAMPSNHLSLPFPPALNFSQHQGLFQWVGSLHQVAILHIFYIFCTCLHRFLVQGKYLLIYKENDPSTTHHF